MKKSLKHIDGNSDKFWEIEVTGSQFTVTYGKNGTAGISQTKSFASEEECMKTAKKLVAEKIKKGYSETGEVTIISKAKTVEKNNIDEILEEYDRIISSEDINLLLTFLKEKSKGNVAALKKYINTKRYHQSFLETTNDSIPLSAIALFNKIEINSWDEVLTLLNEIEQKPHVLEVLLWAKPNWLESFILDKSKREIWKVTKYTNLRRLEDHNLIQFNPELYALSLSETCQHRLKINVEDFLTLFNDETAYQRDIPQLFNYPTDFHLYTLWKDSHKYDFWTDLLQYTLWTDLHQHTFWKNNTHTFWKDDSYNSIWILIFKSLLEDNKMARSFFIENAIQIQTKDWNNDLKIFFRKRIDELNIMADELILHQEKVFLLLHYSFPPITSYGIELVKKICDHPKFKAKLFLEWLESLMMRSDCKAAIKNVLPILEKLSEANPKLNTSITSIIADVYVIADLPLQERATKIITKIGDVKDKVLREKLSSYVTLMQGNVKFDLASFLDQDTLAIDETAIKEYTYTLKKELLLTEEVSLPKDWNAILFQFGNFISSDDFLDSEILLNTYITQRDLFPADYTAQLQPYAKQLEKKHFENPFKRIIKSFLECKIANIDDKLDVTSKYYTRFKTISSIQLLLARAQQKLETASILPLLSFPSHKPYWVAPKVLLERIIAYQKTNEEIDFVDLALAIARMPRENVWEAIPLLDQVEGELQPLLSFCLGVNERIELNPESLSSKGLPYNLETDIMVLWAVAARTFYPNTTFPEFENTHLKDIPLVVSPFNPEERIKEQWIEAKNSITKKKEFPFHWLQLSFNEPNYFQLPDNLLYSLDIIYRGKYYGFFVCEEKTVHYWHSLTPQNLDALGIILLRSCSTTGGSQEELKGFLNLISRPEFQFSDTTLLLYACCFFQEKKEIRLLASEKLINLVEKQEIDMEAFAQKLAFLVSRNYGMFTHMADSITAVKDVSSLHNSALFQFYNAFFAYLELQELPRNFKKMVENYVDVLIKTNQKPSTQAITFFEQWKDNTSLKSLIKQILK
jgi:predicted DNA-binding WGR domain protein